jgi:hypothetical protein
MKKPIRILEVPFYLLVIAMGCIEHSYPLFIFLTLVSIARLIVNVTTDEFIYKR